MPKNYVDARRMFICLACFEIDAWLAVLVCTLTCWKTKRDDPTLIATGFLTLGMTLANPPWHSIVFEAAHRLTTPLGNRSMIALSGIGIAVLSQYYSATTAALLGAIGAGACLLPQTAKYGGTVVALAWAASAHSKVKYIWLVGPAMLLSDFPASHVEAWFSSKTAKLQG